MVLRFVGSYEAIFETAVSEMTVSENVYLVWGIISEG